MIPGLAREHDVVALDLPGLRLVRPARPTSPSTLYPAGGRGPHGRARPRPAPRSSATAWAAQWPRWWPPAAGARGPAGAHRLRRLQPGGEESAAADPLVGSPPVAAVLDRHARSPPPREAGPPPGLLRRHARHRRARRRVPGADAPSGRPRAPIRSLLASRSLHPDAVRKLLPRVTAPTLVLWGQRGRMDPGGDADRFAAALPGSRVVVLDRCGHMPQEEHPADVLRWLQVVPESGRVPRQRSA